jgi:hypothetical protein
MGVIGQREEADTEVFQSHCILAFLKLNNLGYFLLSEYLVPLLGSWLVETEAKETERAFLTTEDHMLMIINLGNY